MVFFDLRFLQQQLKMGGGLAFFYIISLFTFESSIVLSLITFYFIYKGIFSIETTIKNALKGRKPGRKP
jgi:hypothetical protein